MAHTYVSLVESARSAISRIDCSSRIGPAAGNESWAVRASGLDAAGPRTGVNDCSVVGPGGWTGCYSSWLRSVRDERRATRRATDALPGNARSTLNPDRDEEEEDGE